MRTLDYARLGLRNIGAHKKRVAMVVVIIGALFGVLTAACMLFAGIERVVLDAQTATTHGRVLLSVVVDPRLCEDEGCDYEKSVTEMRDLIARYDGEAIEGNIYYTSAGMFYELPEGVLDVEYVLPEDTELPVVAVPPSTAQRWLRMSEGGWNGTLEKKVKTAEQIRERALHQTIEYKGYSFSEGESGIGDKYYIADLVSPGGGASTLMLDGALKAVNPLNLVLGTLNVGSGVNFVLRPNQEMLAQKKTMAEEGRLIASFATIEEAIKFTKDPATRCREEQVMFNSCPPEYKFTTSPLLLSPLENYEVFGELKILLGVLVGIFCVVAAIVALTTFVRLIRSDTKTIALYYALGASRSEVLLIYLVYLLGICVITIGFILVLAVVLTLLMNLLNATGLSQTFMLAYGGEMRRIWLIGFSPEIWVMLGIFLLTAPVGILLSIDAFSSRKVLKQLK